MSTVCLHVQLVEQTDFGYYNW